MIYPDIAQIHEDDKFQSPCHETKWLLVRWEGQ